MNSETFVRHIRKSIIEDNLAIYKDLFESTDPDGTSDPYWARALTLYADLRNEQKTVFLEVIRQVMADTVSNFVGVLDGVSTLDGSQEDLKLMTDSCSEQLNGNLQDLFLELEEEA